MYARHPMQVIPLLQSTMAPYSLPIERSPNHAAIEMGAKCCPAPDCCAAPGILARPGPCHESELQRFQMESVQQTASHLVEHLWACQALQHPQARWALQALRRC